MSLRQLMNTVYENPKKAPWYNENIPKGVIDIVQRGMLKEGAEILDIACGLGYSSIYLAKQGYRVTAIDISEKAIVCAQELAIKEGVAIDFRVMPSSDILLLEKQFDFILEFGLLHFIPFEDRPAYRDALFTLLKKDGLYFSMSFGLAHQGWGGQGRIRKGNTGAMLYFAEENEMSSFFSDRFRILEHESRLQVYKNTQFNHLYNYFLLGKP